MGDYGQSQSNGSRDKWATYKEQLNSHKDHGNKNQANAPSNENKSWKDNTSSGINQSGRRAPPLPPGPSSPAKPSITKPLVDYSSKPLVDYPITNKPKPLVDYPIDDEDKISYDNKRTASPRKSSNLPSTSNKDKHKTLKELCQQHEPKPQSSQNSRFAVNESVSFDSTMVQKPKPTFKMVDPSVAFAKNPNKLPITPRNNSNFSSASNQLKKGFDRNTNIMPISPQNKSNSSFASNQPLKGFDRNPNEIPITPRNKTNNNFASDQQLKGFDRPLKGFDRVSNNSSYMPVIHNSWATKTKPASLMSINTSTSSPEGGFNKNNSKGRVKWISYRKTKIMIVTANIRQYYKLLCILLFKTFFFSYLIYSY